MKKTLITIVLVAFCFSVPVFASTSRTITPASERTLTAGNTKLPVFAQYRRGRRIRRARRIIVRHDRRAYRRQRFIIRHRRRR